MRPVEKPAAPSSIASRRMPFIRSSSASVAGRLAMPITAMRRLLWPMYILAFAVSFCWSAYSRKRAKLLQFFMSSGNHVVPIESMFWTAARFSGMTGAIDRPHWPVSSVVTPCVVLKRCASSEPRMRSPWEWASIQPGLTYLPLASMTAVASSLPSAMTSFPPEIPMLPL